jgi:hypothetical protein
MRDDARRRDGAPFKISMSLMTLSLAVWLMMIDDASTHHPSRHET